MTSLDTQKQVVETDVSGGEHTAALADFTDSKIKNEPTSQEQDVKIKPDTVSQETASETNNDNNNNNNARNGHANDESNRDEDNNDGGEDDGDDAQFEDDNDESNNIVARSSDDAAVGDNEAENEDDNEKTNLIVNYLPQQMADEEFVQLFEKFGKMKSCKIIRNKMTGYSYGFGFADYETHEQAIKAIDELNGHQLGDKKIKVAFARPAGQDIKQANLYVKNIPVSWNQDDVRKVFEPYGQIIQVRVIGNDRGVAFVLFDLRKQAQDALEALNGKKVDGCEEPFEIKFAAEKKGEKRGSRGGRNRSGRGDRNNQRSGSLSGMRNNQQNNMRNNRGNSDSRRSTSQGRGGNNMYNNRNNNGMSQYGPGSSGANNNNNNSMSGGGVGPARHAPTNRASRYAPFAPPLHQATPVMAPQPMNPYGYPQQQMLPYMMPNQMMQMPMGQPQPMSMGGGPAMNPYAMAPQMGPIAYAQPSMSQPSVAMNNMYNVASTTMNQAAQMQPQLGQPMNMRSAGGASSGSSGAGGQQNDGITLFVYNIGPDCDENQLRDMFAPYGSVVRSNVVRKNPGGETKGFGFVTMKTRDQASAAIGALNNAMKNGRTLQVSFKK